MINNMSISGISTPYRPSPALPPTWATGAPAMPMPPLMPMPTQTDGILFDRFKQQQCQPVLTLTQQDKTNALLHPQLYRQLQQLNTAEDAILTLKMALQIQNNLDPLTQQKFKQLINQGVLTKGTSDDGHSALYHLYGILTTPRATGYGNRTILRETIEVLAQPYSISQRFAPTTPQVAQQLLHVRNNPGLNRSNVPPPIKPLTVQDLNVESSATCVASSVMYYMADKEPTQLARHINELTSPMNAFFEKARFSEISPDAPQQALQILKEHQIPYYISGPDEVTVKVENPPAGVIRAQNSQNLPANGQFRNAIGAAYQSAITYLVTHSYDPASDERDADAPGETSKGLTEAEKTLMEAIIKDNGGVQSVTYQAVNNKANPASGEENNSYLFGYNRRFEETTNDILQALSMGQPVIIGTTDTDETGAIVAGHEITITSAYTDPQDGQLKFIVADSDDNIPEPVAKSARELIPTIHHAGLPVNLARQINQQIQSRPGYLVPDAQDQAKFKLLAHETGPMPADETTAMPAANPAPANPFANPSNNIEWLPVSQVYPQPKPQPFATLPATGNPFSQINPNVNPFLNTPYPQTPFQPMPLVAAAG